MITSKFKIKALLIMFCVNILSGFLFWKVLQITLQKTSLLSNTSAIIAIATVTILELCALFILNQFKRIQIEKDKIIVQNLIFPFLKKTTFFSEYDYSVIVDEYTKYEIYETFWLIKNGKIKDEISSFHYSNYNVLKLNVSVQSKGKLKINMFKQFFCRLGMRI